MVANGNQSMIDFYPIVVELDDDALGSSRSNSASIYKTVASEASWFHSERSRRPDEDRVEIEDLIRKEQRKEVEPTAQQRRKFGVRFVHENPPSPPSVRRDHSNDPSHRCDCDEEFGHKSDMGGVFTAIQSLLQLGSHPHKNESTDIRNPVSKDFGYSNVSPIPSPCRVGTKWYRPRRFQDDYVLTQQIVQCRTATLWECVHRTTGRRYCAKAIDKRRFGSQSDRATAAREINMLRSILQCSQPSCLPRVRDIFADGEAAEQMQQHDEAVSLASCCSESTKSISSQSACDDSQWYIVQDFEARGGNLGLYLLGREQRIFDVPENGDNDDVGTEIIIKNEFHSLAEPSRVASNTMHEAEVRSLARSLLLAVNELHRRSICHNDLCLENILVPISPTNHHRDVKIKECCTEGIGRHNQETDGYGSSTYRHIRHRRMKSHDESSGGCWEDLKLCDLGRAFFDDESTCSVSLSGNLTSDTIPRHSSIYYTSPEVIMGKSPSLASDMWSVGVILYRCFAGELPFREQSDGPACLGYSRTSAAGVPIKTRLRQQLKHDICRSNCTFGRLNRRKTDFPWSRVSRGAKHFLSALLNPSPSDRMTCDEALYHPWLTNGLSSKDWSTSMGSFMHPQPSPSISLSMKPIVKALTTTNHYHHHPNYTTAEKSLSPGHTSHHLEEESLRSEQDTSSVTTCSVSYTANTNSPLADDSAQFNRGRPKSFVHRLFGHLKTSNDKRSCNEPNPTTRFVID